MLGDVRLDNKHFGIRFADDTRSDILGRRFPQIVDIWFESQSHTGHYWIFSVLSFQLAEDFQHAANTPVGFIIIGFARTLDDLRLVGIVGNDELVVDGNTVPAHAADRL